MKSFFIKMIKIRKKNILLSFYLYILSSKLNKSGGPVHLYSILLVFKRVLVFSILILVLIAYLYNSIGILLEINAFS